MAVFNPFRAPRGTTAIAQTWGGATRDPVPTVSSRLTSRWSPDLDGRQVWRWSVVDPAHP